MCAKHYAFSISTTRFDTVVSIKDTINFSSKHSNTLNIAEGTLLGLKSVIELGFITYASEISLLQSLSMTTFSL